MDRHRTLLRNVEAPVKHHESLEREEGSVVPYLTSVEDDSRDFMTQTSY